MNDLASSNDVATNGVNGRIGNKTWCKCERCAPMETSIEGVCCLEIPGICKPSFSSISCLKVCRSDPYFVIWFSRWENFVGCLISTHCWSLANQNKSFRRFNLIVFSKALHFILNQIFFFIRDIFYECIFQKSIRLDSGGPLLLKSISYHLNHQK